MSGSHWATHDQRGRGPPYFFREPSLVPRKARWEDKQPARSAEAARAGVRPVQSNRPYDATERTLACALKKRPFVCSERSLSLRALFSRGDS